MSAGLRTQAINAVTSVDPQDTLGRAQTAVQTSLHLARVLHPEIDRLHLSSSTLPAFPCHEPPIPLPPFLRVPGLRRGGLRRHFLHGLEPARHRRRRECRDAPNPVTNTGGVAPGDFKALVCLFLYGGNDSNNVLVPSDAKTYAMYAAARGGLALPQSSLLPITPATPDGRTYGLHPSLVEMRNLFAGGKAALMANVGTLVAPVTRATYLNNSAQAPARSFFPTRTSKPNGRPPGPTARRAAAGAGAWPICSVRSTARRRCP